MTSTPLQNLIQERVDRFQKQSIALQRQSQKLSLLRSAVFVIGLVTIVYFANARMGLEIAMSTALTTIIFLLILKRHNKAKFELRMSQNLVDINQQELLRLQGQLHDLPAGNEYQDQNHPYAPDLDVFGHNSLYQLLVRSHLPGANRLLAHWLLQPSTKHEIEKRQAAIAELRPEIDWRQHITALAHQPKDKLNKNTDLTEVILWMNQALSSYESTKWKILQWVVPGFSLGLALMVAGYQLPAYWYALPILVNSLIFRRIFKPLLDSTQKMDGVSKILDIYGLILKHYKTKSFQTDKLQQLSESLLSGSRAAAPAIQGLNRILYFLENRANMLYVSINMYFATDLWILVAAAKWKKKYIEFLPLWMDAIHELEALNDLAAYAYLNPHFTFPEITNEPYQLQAEQLGHPLIKPHQRIVNDVNMQGEGTLDLITGSNMSGKSTFLRTLGVNLVLAQMGAPVCASSFHFSLTRIFTSMRTQDNLEENVSSFYAELKRIKSLLDTLGDQPMFYLLDEILKGTNSEDRHGGAMALIDQLTKNKCMGLVSTHDVQLAELSQSNQHITNHSFNSVIEGDEIIFDYRLTPGPCRSFNASKLMEKMGIIK